MELGLSVHRYKWPGLLACEQAPLPAEFSHRTLEFYFGVSCYFLCLGFTIPSLEDLPFFFPIRLEKYIPPAYSIPVHTLTRTNKGQQFSHHRIVISCITQGQAEGTTRQLGHRFPESKNTYTEQPTNSSIRICESSKGKKSKDKATYWQGWQKCTRILSVSF